MQSLYSKIKKIKQIAENTVIDFYEKTDFL